jgi:two-component system cell cycle response regulator
MKILIAEDDPVSRRLLEAFLVKWEYEVVVAGDGEEALRLLEREDAPRLAILDWMMPGKDGIQVCREIRGRENQPYVYILLLSARGNKRDVIEGLETGADDYLTKPFDPFELRARLRTGRRILELQEQVLSALAALRVEATHDPLTGLWNRTAILEIVQRELARAQRQETSLAVSMADLDHFKCINDAYGHLAGDAVLREVTRRMRASIRRYDEIGRYGGEEFLIVTPGCDARSALRQAERLRTRIAAKAMDIFKGTIPVTISLGVAVTRRAKEADSLLRAADAALYGAKNRGRNRVEVAPGEETPTSPVGPPLNSTETPSPPAPLCKS